VIYTVRDFASHLGLSIAVKGRVWITQKPLDPDNAQENVGPRLQITL
jgi:hypothetical protein